MCVHHAQNTHSGSTKLTKKGHLWAWGRGADAQLGLGDVNSRFEPAFVGGRELFGGPIATAAAAGAHTLAVTEGGAVWSWGKGDGGRLGQNDLSYRLAPAKIEPERFGGRRVVAVSCGSFQSVMVTEDGKLYTCGRAASYPGSMEPAGLGHSDLEDKLVPTLVPPSLLGNDRVGRCLPLQQDLALAFAMGSHPQLGPPCMADLLPEIVMLVLEACRGWPEGSAGKMEGVARLLGGGSALRKRGWG